MMTWEKVEAIEALLSCGISLEAAGSSGRGLTKEQALSVLETLKADLIPILGGGVWEQMQQNLEFTYDHWYCNSKSDETLSDFVERSIQVARAYILKYPYKKGVILFELSPMHPSSVEYVRMMYRK